MRILTWNLGLFSWYKYFKYLGSKIKHEYFQNTYTDVIEKQIREIDPKVCVLQEFFTEEDIVLITQKLKYIFPYYHAVPTWYHEHSILVLSTQPIACKRLGNSEFFIFQTNKFSFVPIHLNSFHAKKRLQQVQDLLEEIKKREIDCVLGDTNFWAVGKNDFFLFNKDKYAYSQLLNRFKDCTQGICTTKTYLNFDRIFLGKEVASSAPVCLRKNAPRMDHFPAFVDVQI